MARKNPKAKGNKFERSTCKEFSLWASKGRADDWFWRTPSSGGRATERAKKGLAAQDYAGDMMALNPAGRILTKENCFEFKNGYKEISLTSMLDKLDHMKDPILVEWWRKLEEERRTHKKKRGFLVFKRDYKKTCIAMSSKTWLMELGNKKNPRKYAIMRYGKYYLCIVLFEDFLKYFSIEDLKSQEPEKKTRLSVRRKTKTQLSVRRKK